MAKVGMEYFVAAELDEEVSVSKETVAYKNARVIGPAASVSATPNSADVKDYGDDRVQETDVSVTGGTYNVELNEPTLENEAWMLGHTMLDNGGMLAKTGDIPPYLGNGFVGKSRRSNKTIYRAKVYYKTQFKEPTAEYNTKEDNVTFNHTTMEGNIMELEDGSWKEDAEFDTLDEAKAYINSILNVESDTTGGGSTDGGDTGNQGTGDDDDKA